MLSVAASPPAMYDIIKTSGGKQLTYSILRQDLVYAYEVNEAPQVLTIPVDIMVATGEVAFAAPGKNLVKTVDFTEFMVAFTKLIAEIEATASVVLESLTWNPIPTKNICEMQIREILHAGTGTALVYELHFGIEKNRITDKVKLDAITLHARDEQGNPVTVPLNMPDTDNLGGGRNLRSSGELIKVRAALATVGRTIGASIASGQGSFGPGGTIEIKASSKDGTMRSPHAFRVGIHGFQVDGADRGQLKLQWLFEACTVMERVDRIVDGEMKEVVVPVDNGAGFHRYSSGERPRKWFALHQTKDTQTPSIFKQDQPFANEAELLEYWLDHGFPPGS